MNFLLRLFTGRRHLPSGRLSSLTWPSSKLAWHWVAVPSRHAWAFFDANGDAFNALSFAHMMRQVAARWPRDAAPYLKAIEEVRAIERAHPDAVVFVIMGLK